MTSVRSLSSLPAAMGARAAAAAAGAPFRRAATAGQALGGPGGLWTGTGCHGRTDPARTRTDAPHRAQARKCGLGRERGGREWTRHRVGRRAGPGRSTTDTRSAAASHVTTPCGPGAQPPDATKMRRPASEPSARPSSRQAASLPRNTCASERARARACHSGREPAFQKDIWRHRPRRYLIAAAAAALRESRRSPRRRRTGSPDAATRSAAGG